MKHLHLSVKILQNGSVWTFKYNKTQWQLKCDKISPDDIIYSIESNSSLYEAILNGSTGTQHPLITSIILEVATILYALWPGRTIAFPIRL